MKKKTIATSLLAILVSTYAAPFVSNAETISGGTKGTTEQVETPRESTESTESTKPTESTESTKPTESTESTESTKPTESTETPEDDQSKLPGIKQDALNKIKDLLNYGQIDDATYMQAQAAIIDAKTAEEVAQVIADVEATIQANTATTLASIKEEAKDQLLGWFNEGLLTPNDYAFYLNEINEATDAEAVAAVVANAEQQAQQNGLHVDLDAIKEAAKDQLFNWLSYGQINDNQYINGLNAINEATTAEEVNSIIAGIQAEIDEATAVTLDQIKQDAKDQLFAWYNEGLLTAEDYTFYLSQVVSATDAEAVAAVIANAEAQIQQNGLHNDDPEDVTNKPEATPSNPEDVTNKPEATPSEDNKTENTLISKTADTKQEVKKETIVTKVSKNEGNKKDELPKTGEVNQNLTALGLMSVALGSLVAVIKRKRS